MKSFLQILFFFLLIHQLAFSQWTNQNPVPNGNDLWSVFFVDDNTGWIVGSDGFLKKTTNAGVDWIEKNSNTTLTLKSIQFVDQNTGWICGELGLILKTTDGGSNWFSLTSSTTQHLTDVHFCNLDTGYTVGFCGIILKTTNGGTSWTSLTSGTTNDLNSVDFVDTFIGYAVGGRNPVTDSTAIIQTTDGGTNWIDKSGGLPPLYYGINTVEFIDANTGFIGGGIGSGYLFKTTDSGNTWFQPAISQLRPQEINEIEIESIYNAGGINSIYFKVPNIGYAVSGADWGCTNDRRIYRTTDGGSTWNETYRAIEQNGLISVYVNGEGQGWAVGLKGIILITEDDGNSWKQILSGTFKNNSSGDDIFSVFNVDENMGWAVGGREDCLSGGSMILKTIDGGKIWKTQLHVTSSYGSFRSVYFINELFGWVVTSQRIDQTTTSLGINQITVGQGIYRTTDGGENWIVADSIDASSVFFINQDTGWVTSDWSNIGIYKSTDGGITLDQKSSISSSSVFFSDINNGWAVGAAGSILKSTDGGETWVTKTSGTTNDLNCVRFYNSNIGMCVGNAGTVLLSTNGGENWIQQNVGTSKELTAVGFTNSTTIWITGYGGTIFSTTNLGYNWTSYDSVTTNNLISLSFINEYTGWIGGMNGTIFKYSAEPPPPPVWLDQLLVKDAGGTESSKTLTFGQHKNATDGIDALLGEYELPPPPPNGIFDIRFNLPTNPPISSLIDYRDSAKTDIIWTMTFQPGSSGYPMTFTWDSTKFPEGTFYLKDRINGSFVNVNMKNHNSYTLTNSIITSLNISYRGLSKTISVNNEWNMISVPLLAEDMSLSNLFTTATSLAYGYDGGYFSEDTLAIGRGYWLKFGGNEHIQIYGLKQGETVPVQEGWNMFGVYENDIPVNQITTTPSGIIATYFFGYDDGYYIADTLKSGQGFWVRVTQDGVLNLNVSSLEKTEEDKQPIAKLSKDLGKIKITDSKGKTVTLYATDQETNLNFYDLPPLPPSEIFDVRFSSGKLVEDISSEKIIQISSDNYPITLRAEEINIAVRDLINGELLNEELTDGKEIMITYNKITSVEITGRITRGLPISYELYQNYPNPFNPSTVIEFSLPENVSNVKLTIYSILGEKVAELVNTSLVAGKYSYQWNAGNVATGMYIYELRTDKFVSVEKMLLLK